MAWSFVQGSSSVAQSNTGTLPANLTPGTLAVAFIHSTSNPAFSVPAPWINAAGAGIVGSRTEIWYLPPLLNPGGFNSLTAVLSGTMRFEMAEYSPNVPNAVVAATAAGTATNAAATSLPVTASPASLAGDLAVCGFLDHYAAGATTVWTDPSGFTLITDITANNANPSYCAHQLSVSAGAVSATGNTGASGVWSGAVVGFHIFTPGHYVTTSQVTLSAGAFTPDAGSGDRLGVGSYAQGAGSYGSGGQVIVPKGTRLSLDPSGPLFTAIGAANLAPWSAIQETGGGWGTAN